VKEKKQKVHSDLVALACEEKRERKLEQQRRRMATYRARKKAGITYVKPPSKKKKLPVLNEIDMNCYNALETGLSSDRGKELEDLAVALCKDRNHIGNSKAR